jgi:hypothetical protein
MKPEYTDSALSDMIVNPRVNGWQTATRHEHRRSVNVHTGTCASEKRSNKVDGVTR